MRDDDRPWRRIWSLSSERGLCALERVLLGHDGSMTNLLELVFGQVIELKTIRQEVVRVPLAAARRLEISQGDLVNDREILLVLKGDAMPLLYARSFTPLSRLEPAFKADLLRADIPIGHILQAHKIESRRTLVSAGYRASSRRMQRLLCDPGPYLWRTYNILAKGKPLITITETFSLRPFRELSREEVKTSLGGESRVMHDGYRDEM